MAKSSLPRPKGRSRKSAEILHLGGSQVLPGIDHPDVVAAARGVASKEATRFTHKKLTELLAELDAALSAVFVTAQALDSGDERTDLEHYSAAVLRAASEALEFVYDDLGSLRLELPANGAQP